MPATSKNQQIASAIARQAKEGKIPVSKLHGASKSMYESMSKEQLGHFAKTKRKGLPKHVKESEDAAFVRGFMDKCAEYGVDPEALAQHIQLTTEGK